MASPVRNLATPVLVFASIGAALIHAAVVPAHAEWPAAAAFFAGLAMFQVCWALLALIQPPRRGFLLLGIAVNVATLALWAGSRTVGMPFGPDRGEIEAFGRTDVLAALLEVAVVAAAWWSVRTGSRQRESRPARHFALATGATGAVVSLVAIVALGGASEHHHHGTGHPAATHLAADHQH